MKLPNFKRLNKGDYGPEEQNLIDKLSYSINTGIETLYDALNNKLTFKDNIASSVVSFTCSVDAMGKPQQTTQIKLSNTLRIEGVMVVSIFHAKDPNIFSTGYPLVNYSVSNDILTITNIKGVQANEPFTYKLIVLN